jgi:toxin HigB-1
MEVEFSDENLARLEASDDDAGCWGEEVVNGFRKVLRFIRAAADERDFRAMRSLNFEKLEGDREGQYSLRLNRQWRLIIQLREGKPKNTVIVTAIVDYH